MTDLERVERSLSQFRLPYLELDPLTSGVAECVQQDSGIQIKLHLGFPAAGFLADLIQRIESHLEQDVPDCRVSVGRMHFGTHHFWLTRAIDIRI